jgi:hypothetical protein
MLRDANEAIYVWFSTLHWKPIANGYSGYAPATYRELRRRLEEHPLDDATIDHLIQLGVTHVAAHPRLIQGLEAQLAFANWEHRFTTGPAPRLRLAAAFERDRLYELMPRREQDR